MPALSLGACDVALLDLVNAYCTVIDDGRYQAPILIQRIEDREGNLIYEARTDRTTQAIPYRSAFFMQQLLRGGLTQPGGTSRALWQYINPVVRDTDFGGKTGTSNNHSDAWYVGVTPKLVAGGWVGGEYRSIHFRTGALGQGSRTALPIYGNFIARTLQDPRFARYRAHFPPPSAEINRADYECAVSYEPPTHYSPDSLASIGPMEGVSFGNGNISTPPATIHAPDSLSTSE